MSTIAALQEIRYYQKSTNLFIAKTCFMRLVREITTKLSLMPLRYQSIAMEALQEAAESFIVGQFESMLLLPEILLDFF